MTQPVGPDLAGFWDKVYTSSQYSRAAELNVLEPALAFFGDVRGRTIIEIGCGPGAASRWFASRGANVIGVDVSKAAIDSLNDWCAAHGITNLRGVCMSAAEIDALGPADFIYGSMILHHIEPFGAFAASLGSALKPGGRAFFYENSAVSNLLIWFRDHVIGKLWIPKYGDPDEFPLTPAEINLLREHFDVEVEYPEMLFFALGSQYLLRGRLMAPFRALDAFLYRRRWLLRYSYRQFVKLRV